MQTYNENDYRLQFQKYDNLPGHSIQQILVDHEATRIRERLYNANIVLLLIFDSDIQRFVPMRNAPSPIGTGNLQKGRSKIWSGFQFREMGQPENNLESLTTKAPEPRPAGSECDADKSLEPPEVIEDHPYMTQEKATLVNNWVRGAAAEVATDPHDLAAMVPADEVQKEKEKPAAEVKKVEGLKRRAVAPARPNAPANAANAAPVAATNDAPTTVENTASNPAPKAPLNAPTAITPPTNAASKEAPSTPVKNPPVKVPQTPPGKQGRLPVLDIPESKYINLAAPKTDVENETKEEPLPSARTVVQTKERVSDGASVPGNQNELPRLQIPEPKLLNLTPPEESEEKKEAPKEPGRSSPILKIEETGLVDPFTAPRLVHKEPEAESKPASALQWPENFNFNAYGPPNPRAAGRGSGRGNGRSDGRGGGKGPGRGAPKTPQKPKPTEARTPRARTGHTERVTSRKPSGPPRLIDTSFNSEEVAKAAVAPMSFSHPALVPQNSKNVATACDDMSSSSNPPPLQAESHDESKESALDAPISEVDTELYEKRLRDLKLSFEKELQQENSEKYVRSESQAPASVSGHSRCNSQASNKSIYQRRLEELEKLRAKERVQVVSEVESRDFHRTMGQKAPAPQQQQKGKSKADIKKEKRQAVLEEAWGIPPKMPTPAKDEKTLEKEKASKVQKEKAKQEVVDPLLAKVYPLLKPILSAAQFYPGTLNLELQFGLIIIPTLPGSYNGNMFEMKDWKRFFYPSHGLVAPSTMFTDRLTTSGSDVDYILDLKDGKGPTTIQFFEEEPSKRDVVYEFHCKTKNTGMIVISISDTGDTVVTRPETHLGSVNMHFPSQTWDARVVLSSKFEYVGGVNAELDRAIQVLVDKLYVLPTKSRVTMYTRTTDVNELDIVKVLVKRTTRHRYIFSTKKGDDGNAAATNADTGAPVPETDDEAVKPAQDSNEVNISPEDPGIFLQITEVQNLFLNPFSNDRNTYHCRARLPETMVNCHRLWYEVSLVSSAIEDMFLENKDLAPGDSVTTWQESDVLGKDAHIDTSHKKQATKEIVTREDTTDEPANNHTQANAVGGACLGEMLRIATRVISRLDGVGYWNEGPLEFSTFENPVGLMLTTAGENVQPGASAAAGATAGGGTAKGVGVGAAFVAAAGEVPGISESGGKDMESASVRAANPGFGGFEEFW